MCCVAFVTFLSQAKLALDQFHTTDRANRRQYFHLHHLEPRKPSKQEIDYKIEYSIDMLCYDVLYCRIPVLYIVIATILSLL